MVAVDYTGSNGHPLDAGSLHFINPVAPNEYLQVRAARGRLERLQGWTPGHRSCL